MTDAVRDQIAADSKEYASTHLGSDGTYFDKENAFRAGAERQHPIAFEAGYNQALDDAINALKSMPAPPAESHFQKLESLKLR